MPMPRGSNPSLVVSVVAMLVSAPLASAARSDGLVQYAAKFVCGKSNGLLQAPGTYYTVINVHNPGNAFVTLHKKFVSVGDSAETPGRISKWVTERLGPDGAFEIDCADIRNHVPAATSPADGFVVIECAAELDVVAVYTTADGAAGVRTMELERVPGRRVASPGGAGQADLVPRAGAGGDYCNRDPRTGRLVVTVCNQGAAAAGASMTRVHFSSGETVSLPTPALAPGQCVNVYASFPNDCATDCGFTITVDAGGVVPESDEGNNVANGGCVG